MKKINFVIAAFNEENRISEVVSSIMAFADQVVIMDPGITDQTIERAREIFPVKVCKVSYDMFDIVSRLNSAFSLLQKNTKSEWVFYLNCSERFTDALGDRLIDLINARDDLVGVDVYRQSYSLGVKTHSQRLFYVVKHLFKRKNNYRLFRISAWDSAASRMHCEFPIVEAKRSQATWLLPIKDRVLRHFRDGNLVDFEKKHSAYSDKDAIERIGRGERPSLLKMILNPLMIMLAFSPTLLGDRRAFIVAAYHAFYKFQVQAKMYMLIFEGQSDSVKKGGS